MKPNTRRAAGLWLMMAAGLSLTAAGCGTVATQGAPMPRGEPGNASFRLEAEWIPQASLVREDMTPRWQLGRYAFIQGQDNLLVVSRIMSVQARDKDGKTIPGAPVRDTKVERLWIVLPANAPIGVPIKMEQHERQFLTGYDMGDIGDTFFVQPNRLVGQVTLLAIKPEGASVLMDVEVRPAQSLMTSWTVNQLIDAPTEPDGHRARRPEPGRTYTPLTSRAVRWQPPTDPLVPLPGVQPTVADSTGSATSPPSSTDATAAATTPDTSTTPPDAAAPSIVDGIGGRSIVGYWTMDHRGRLHHLQFDPNGTFSYVVSRTEGRQTGPRMLTGDWQIKGDYVVIDYQQQAAAPTRSGQPAPFRRKYEALRIGWVGNDLVLTGQIAPEDGPMRMQFQPTTAAAAPPPTDAGR